MNRLFLLPSTAQDLLALRRGDVAMDHRMLQWDACWNVRELGGFTTADGRVTRFGEVIRAGNLSRLTEAGRDALLRYGVRTVVDVRDPKEFAIERDPFQDGERWAGQVHYLNVPLISEEEWTAVRDPEQRRQGYRLTLRLSKTNIRAVLRAVAEAQAGGVVVHCHAGKERTGVISALLLALAGVPDKTIAEDYVASDMQLQELYTEWAARESDPEKRSQLIHGFQGEADHMLGPLAVIAEQGGIASYLGSCGLGEADLAALRARMLGSA
jgi:protein-tyrosine phosphatase